MNCSSNATDNVKIDVSVNNIKPFFLKKNRLFVVKIISTENVNADVAVPGIVRLQKLNSATAITGSTVFQYRYRYCYG